MSDQRSSPLTSDRIGTELAPQIHYIRRDLNQPPSCAITRAFIRAQKHTENSIHTSNREHTGHPRRAGASEGALDVNGTGAGYGLRSPCGVGHAVRGWRLHSLAITAGAR